MIFVTVGTHWFDALVETVDEAVGRGEVTEPVLAQIGHKARYVPRHCCYLTVAPTLLPFYRASDLVVGHGGTGTTLEVLLMRKPLISVANPEMSDNHQDEFLAALQSHDWVTYCRDMAALPGLLRDRGASVHRVRRSGELSQALAKDVAVAAAQPRRRQWLRRLAGYFHAVEIDPARTDRAMAMDRDVWALVQTPPGVTPLVSPPSDRPLHLRSRDHRRVEPGAATWEEPGAFRNRPGSEEAGS